MNENKYDFSSIKPVTKKFPEVSRCSSAKKRQINVQKKVCCACKVAFLLIRPIAVFPRSTALLLPLSIARFYVLFERSIYNNILSRASLSALAKSMTTMV